MASRLELQTTLETMLGTRNVYYQPPESLQMEYTAIRYSRSNPQINHANNSKYLRKNRYDLIVISKKPDDPVIDKILELPYSSMSTPYIADNLYHTPITLYY